MSSAQNTLATVMPDAGAGYVPYAAMRHDRLPKLTARIGAVLGVVGALAITAAAVLLVAPLLPRFPRGTPVPSGSVLPSRATERPAHLPDRTAPAESSIRPTPLPVLNVPHTLHLRPVLRGNAQPPNPLPVSADTSASPIRGTPERTGDRAGVPPRLPGPARAPAPGTLTPPSASLLEVKRWMASSSRASALRTGTGGRPPAPAAVAAALPEPERVLKTVATTPPGNWVRIPSLEINVPLALSPSMDAKEVLQTLQQGVVRYPNGVDPGQPGVLFIAGHSTGEPWKGKYRFAFLHARKLQAGDIIEIDHEGVRYTYRVTGQRIVNPRETAFLESASDRPRLALISCWPLWTTAQRLVVDAELLETARITVQTPNVSST